MRELKYNINCIISFLLFTCLLFLGSCSNEVEMKERPLSSPPVLFNASKDTVIIDSRQTRAGIDESNPAMDTMDDMVNSGKKVLIYGSRYVNGGTPDWTLVSDLFMNGLTGAVVKKESDYRINYSPLKYYDPDDDERYDFKLFFPAPQAPESGLNDPSGVTILPPTGERPHGLRVNLYRRPDLMKATLKEVSKTDQPLEPEFQHLLTSVVLKIVKGEEDPVTSEEINHNIYINRMTVSGVIRGTYDIIKEEFEPPVKDDPDPNLIDAASGASILVPGYTTDEKFLVPSFGEEPKLIREIFFFPVAPTASTARQDLERYFFDIWLNERRYSFMLPRREDENWGGWKAGERYTYTLKVDEADIYIELNKKEIVREPWKPGVKPDGKPGDITIGVDAN